MGTQNFNFDPKFPPNKSFSASKFAFFDEKFMIKRRFSDSPKFRGGSGCLRPRRHWLPSSTRLPPCPSWSPAPLGLNNRFRGLWVALWVYCHNDGLSAVCSVPVLWKTLTYQNFSRRTAAAVYRRTGTTCGPVRCTWASVFHCRPSCRRGCRRLTATRRYLTASSMLCTVAVYRPTLIAAWLTSRRCTSTAATATATTSDSAASSASMSVRHRPQIRRMSVAASPACYPLQRGLLSTSQLHLQTTPIPTRIHIVYWHGQQITACPVEVLAYVAAAKLL